MLKITFKFLLLGAVEYIGLIFALILIYASPDNNLAHTYEASIIFLASSFVAFSIIYNISFKVEKNNFMKYLFIFIITPFILSGVTLGLICKYAPPMETIDLPAMYLFFLSTIIVIAGCIFMLIHNKDFNNE